MSGWVVLDLIEPGEPLPEYCTHGRATCMAPGCKEWVWLGHTTHDLVKFQGYLPICLPCAGKYMRPEDRKGQVTDHKRVWGPHE